MEVPGWITSNETAALWPGVAEIFGGASINRSDIAEAIDGRLAGRRACQNGEGGDRCG